MKIEAVILENFRRYAERTTISLADFTTVIGTNDAGKSTLLEALDIFFGGGTKIDKQDLSIGAQTSEIRIGVVLSGFPIEIDIDRGALTSLEGEFLLNDNGKFEVHKVYNTTPARISMRALAIASHPTDGPLNSLLTLKNAELKKLVNERDLAAGCDLNKNPSMRRALFSSLGDKPILSTTEISLSDGDAAGIWKSLEKYLPVYALFKSDRVSSDQDPEAQNPMKAAVARAVAELAPDLEKMTAQVREMVEETAKRTIDQMKLSYPDLRLASELKPNFQDPKWSSIFKIELSADDGVPLNKRGSGVRRLILMSFFQAEASRAKLERLEKDAQSVPVMYAIEEPETSQHPDNQERIIEALKSVVDSGDQVIITTHNPTLAELLPTNSIRYIDSDPTTDAVRVREADDEVLSEVVDTLGVLPATLPTIGVKVAVLTEGKTDIDALQCFYETLHAGGQIPEIDQTKVFWAFGGGSTVKDWIERRYLDKLGIAQVVIIDSDRDSAGGPTSRTAHEVVELLADNADCQVFVMSKREIENYLHPAALERLSNGTIKFEANWDIDYDRMPKRLGQAITTARQSGRVEFTPIDRMGEPLTPLGTSDGHSKKVITSFLFAQMSVEEIQERGDDGMGGNEIVSWLNAIAERTQS